MFRRHLKSVQFEKQQLSRQTETGSQLHSGQSTLKFDKTSNKNRI